jgi:hypothetical protein
LHNKYKCICSGAEENQEQTILHIEVNKLLLSFREIDERCKAFLPPSGPTKINLENNNGCCCQSVKRGRSEKTYTSGDLRRCLSMTKRDCEKIRSYDTKWIECESSDCGGNCVAGNRPGKCNSCASTFSGRAAPTRTTTAPSTTSTSTYRTTPSTPSMPSSPPSTPSGY